MSLPLAETMTLPFRSVAGAYRAAFSGLPRAVWLLATVTLVNRSGTMVLPFLTLYLTERRGFTPAGAGALMGLYGLGAIAGAYLGGWLCDRIEAKRVMGWSLVLGGVGFLALGALRARPAIAVGIFLLSVVGEAFRPAVASAMVRAAPAEARTRAYALLRLAANLGIMIGPLAAGFLAVRSYLWLFLADGGTCLAAAALLWLSFRERGAAPAAAAEPRPGREASPWRDGPFLAVVGLSLLLSIVFFQLMSTYPLTLRDLYGLSEAYVGVSFTINTLIIVVFEMLLVHGLRDRRPLRVAGVGALFIGLGFGLLPFGSGYGYVAATVVVWTVGEMLSFPMLQGWVAARAAGRAEGRYMGVFTLTFSVAFMVAPIVGTWVYQHLGSQAVWSATAVGGLALGAAFVLLDARLRRWSLASAGPQAVVLLIGVALCGCGPARTPGIQEPNPLEAPPVDAARVRSPEQPAAWRHSESLAADLDGDGAEERVVLAADVELLPDGTPLWEDGHRWAVFVEGAGRRTLLYAAFVPNGHAEAAILAAGSDGRRHVLVEERTPQQAKSLVVEYVEPGKARLVSAAYSQVERWLPNLVRP